MAFSRIFTEGDFLAQCLGIAHNALALQSDVRASFEEKRPKISREPTKALALYPRKGNSMYIRRYTDRFYSLEPGITTSTPPVEFICGLLSATIYIVIVSLAYLVSSRTVLFCLDARGDFTWVAHGWDIRAFPG